MNNQINCKYKFTNLQKDFQKLAKHGNTYLLEKKKLDENMKDKLTVIFFSVALIINIIGLIYKYINYIKL